MALIDGLEVTRAAISSPLPHFCLPYAIGEVDRASGFSRISTEGSCATNTDPSVIRQDRANAISLNEAGEAKFKNTVQYGVLMSLEKCVLDGVLV
jgi:hypothetical protein